MSGPAHRTARRARRSPAGLLLAALAALAACGESTTDAPDGGAAGGPDAGTDGGPPAVVSGRVVPFTPGQLADFATTDAAPTARDARGTDEAALRRADPDLLEATGRAFVPGELLVRLRGEGPEALSELLEALADDPALSGWRFSAGVWAAPDRVTVRVAAADGAAPDAARTAALRDRLTSHPAVRGCDLNALRRARRVPDDPLYDLQWHYRLMGLPAAWDVTVGDPSVVVAVIDDGVNVHPDLEPRVLQGYDMVSDTRFAGDGDGRDPTAVQVPGSQGGRSVWHGLHVAGTIGAVTDNGYGVAGVDWQAAILPVRVLGVLVPDVGAGSTVDVVAGIRWAVGLEVPGVPTNPNPADVLNLSLGGGALVQAEQDAIDEAVDAGAVVVVAAGNEGADAGATSLGGYENVIVVGATGLEGERAPYSNFGPAVDVMAPGGRSGNDANADGQPDGILSTWLGSEGVEPQAFFLDGTSMAAPHVTGVVALMKAVAPDLTAVEVEALLKATADPAFQCPEGCGAGLVNAAAAVRAAAGDPGLAAAPRLAVSTERLVVGPEGEAVVLVFNAGGGSLTYAARVEGAAADRVTVVRGGEGTLSGGASTTVGLSVDRAGLPDGIYDAALVLESDGGTARVPLAFRVGAPPPQDVGQVVVAAVTRDEADALVVGAETATTLEEDYAFSLPVPPGEWLIVALADVDGDDTADRIGIWRRLDAVETLVLAPGDTREDVDILLVPFEGEVPLEAPPLACDGLRRCLEACGADLACVEACPVALECEACLAEEVVPCVEASGCEDADCVCGACAHAYEACLGPLSCETTEAGAGG